MSRLQVFSGASHTAQVVTVALLKWWLWHCSSGDCGTAQVVTVALLYIGDCGTSLYW